MARLAQRPPGMGNFLWLLAVLLVIGWFAGLMFEFGGGLIHVLVVVAVLVCCIQFLRGRRPA